MYTLIKVIIVFTICFQTVKALCSFDCDDKKCCYAGISNIQCKTWNGTENSYETTRPHRVLLFQNKVCWVNYDGTAKCKPPLKNIQANDIRDFGKLLFVKTNDKIIVVNSTGSYSLKTTSWFPESPPSRLTINNHGTCEWIEDTQSTIKCQLHGQLKKMTPEESCDTQPMLNAFNLVAIIGICVSFTTLCLILAYYKVAGANYIAIQEDADQEIELVQVPEDISKQMQQESVIDTLI